MDIASNSIETLSGNIALLGYGLASVFYLLGLQKSARSELTYRAGLVTFALASVAAATALAAAFATATTKQLSAMLLTTVISWLAIGGQLQFKLRVLGAFVAPLCTLMLLVKYFLAPSQAAAAPASDSSVLVATHVILSVLGQGFAIIACAVSLIYLWLQRLLKKKLLQQVTQQNFPAIDRIERALIGCLWTGFVFLTLGLVTGAIYTQLHLPPPELRLTVKVIWAILVWLWYLAILLGRNAANWSARRIARLSLAGFLLLAVSYFGMGFFRV